MGLDAVSDHTECAEDAEDWLQQLLETVKNAALLSARSPAVALLSGPEALRMFAQSLNSLSLKVTAEEEEEEESND